jgi:mRNA interferase HigB
LQSKLRIEGELGEGICRPSFPLKGSVQIITRKHLSEAAEHYPDAAREIWAWYRIANDARWRNFVEVRAIIHDADDVDGYVIFNIRQNRYRLVTIIHYAREKDGRTTMGRIYIRAFLTHRQYDTRANWDKGVDR